VLNLVAYSVYQFIDGKNDSNSNTRRWSQRHNLVQTVIKRKGLCTRYCWINMVCRRSGWSWFVSQDVGFDKGEVVRFVSQDVGFDKTPLSNPTSGDTNRTTSIHFQNSSYATTYVNTCHMIIIITKLVSILFHFHTVVSHLLLNLWHRNDSEPQVRNFLLAFESCLLLMMTTHFFDTPYWFNSNVCTISCLMSLW